MNWYGALQHAFIGYGIRRKAWPENYVLFWDQDKLCLRWMMAPTIPMTSVEPECKLLEGGDISLSGEAIKASDWEAI